MTLVLIYTAVTLLSFLAMEAVAWATHKYVMHGWLWVLHSDHHKPGSAGFFERNDFFFLLFATPGIACLWIGMEQGFNYLFFVGLGITLYGIAYFIIHDIFIHRRIRALGHMDFAYLRAIRKAHKVHHKHLGRHDGECFGMLLVPRRFIREAKKAGNR